MLCTRKNGSTQKLAVDFFLFFFVFFFFFAWNYRRALLQRRAQSKTNGWKWKEITVCVDRLCHSLQSSLWIFFSLLLAYVCVCVPERALVRIALYCVVLNVCVHAWHVFLSLSLSWWCTIHITFIQHEAKWCTCIFFSTNFLCDWCLVLYTIFILFLTHSTTTFGSVQFVGVVRLLFRFGTVLPTDILMPIKTFPFVCLNLTIQLKKKKNEWNSIEDWAIYAQCRFVCFRLLLVLYFSNFL